MPWPSGSRDTTEWPEVSVEIHADLRDHLNAFTSIDGVGWNDFSAQSRATNLNVADSRLRTYRKMYERLGVVRKEGEKLRVTGFGKELANLANTLSKERDEILQALAIRASKILVRYTLRNPVEHGAEFNLLPEDCDIRPFVAIWKSMLALEGRLHFQEMNRVLLHVLYMRDLEAAISKIQRARKELTANYNDKDEQRLRELLGPEANPDQPSARMAAWFSMAGWGGLIIERNSDASGFRNLSTIGQKILPAILAEPPPTFIGGTEQEWYDYYFATESSKASAAPQMRADGDITSLGRLFSEDLASEQVALKANEIFVARLLAALLAKRFLILTGLAGSGKTKLAQAFARWITPLSARDDVFQVGARIESDRIIYYVKRSDSLAVEFWNSENDAEATKVTLPRAMIQEWANYIQANALTRSTPVRTIREAVKSLSKYSDQLHGFETHLKAAAFALIESQANTLGAKCYEVVAVGADWTGNENILGYQNGLDPRGYVSKPALDLIIHAADEANKEIPHFLILDEMNLSHVERYFADLLSAIESEEGLELYPGDPEKQSSWRKAAAEKPIPPRLKRLPENLFIIGTVNVDETTYMFSPKVLDRANVIEFRMDGGELEEFLANPIKPAMSQLDARGMAFGRPFVDSAKGPARVPSEVKDEYEAEMILFFKALQTCGAEFGYRTAYESGRFIHFYQLVGGHLHSKQDWFSNAFDYFILQKILPKLHGSRPKLGPVLKTLWFLCVNGSAGRGTTPLEAAKNAARSTDKRDEPSFVIPADAPYARSAEKICRIWNLLRDNGFASFAEA